MLVPDQNSIDFINKIRQKDNQYRLSTTIPDLFIDAKFGMLDNGNYELSFNLLADHMSKGINMDYFFTRPFILFNQAQKILVQNTDIIQATQEINPTSAKLKAEFKAFKGDIDDSMWVQTKQSAYIPFNSKIFEPYELGVKFDITTDKARGDRGFFNAIKLNIDNIDLIFYYERVDNDNGYYIVITNGLVDYQKFRDIVDAIMIAFGVLSGFYMADSIYFISIKSKNINDITYRYENIKQATNSKAPIISTGHYQDIPEDKLKLTSEQFNEFVRLLYKNEDYKRSAMLLINAGNERGCTKATLGAVALETITNVVGKDITNKMIVENKQTISAIKNKLIKILEESKDQLSGKQFNVLKRKIELINTVPNADKYIDAFRISGIELDEEELYCLKCRNLFLHGTLPKRKQDIMLSDDELLDVVSNRLVMLSAILLLKQSGYTGYVIDKGMTDVINWRILRAGEKATSGCCLREITKSNANN